MIAIALCGLPGTGKSTLARALGLALRCPVLDKDRVREALFGPAFTAFSQDQDDHCCRVLHQTAAWLARHGRGDGTACEHVVLDGRTYSKAKHVGDLVQAASDLGFDVAFVECTAPSEVVEARLEHDRRTGAHAARDRTVELYRRLAREREPLSVPHLWIDTHRDSLDAQAARVLEHVRSLATRGHRSQP